MGSRSIGSNNSSSCQVQMPSEEQDESFKLNSREEAPKTELPPCQSSHVLMLQLSRGICSFAWMSFCFKVFEGDPLRVEKMLFSVYLKYSFSGSGLSEGWEGFLNIRGSNTTLKIQCSKLWGKIFKKWWYDYLWPGAGIWSDRVREITAKMFHCT